MEQLSDTAKAKEISGYIRAIYGERELGLVRLLGSVPYFRTAVTQGKLPELLGMSLLSFEKYLREQHDLFYRYDGHAFTIERLTGGYPATAVLGQYPDDYIFSIGGALVAKLRALHPDANALCSAPLVSLGHGVGVDNLLGRLDIPGISSYIGKLPDAYVTDDIAAAIDDYARLVEEGGEVAAAKKYLAVDAIHKLYVKLRLEPIDVTEQQELPPCEPLDFMSVVMGTKRASVHPPEGGRLPPTLVNCLQEAHPDGEVRDGAFILKGDVVLDPFKYVGSTRVAVELPDLNTIPVVVAPIQPARPVAPPPVPEGRFPPRAPQVDESVRDVGPGFEEAVDHVLNYFGQYINSMQPEEQEVALYGFRGGKATYERMSVTARRGLAHHVPLGRHEPYDILYRIGQAIRAALRNRVELSEEQYALMAAGRVIAWKGNYDILPDGRWDKLR